MSKPNFNKPKIYTGGVEIADWKLLTKKQKEEALNKSWYVYYSFRDPETGNLKRQNPIKGYANSYKTKTDRIQYLTTLRDALELLLQNGISPYTKNDFSFLDKFEESSTNATQKISVIPKAPESKENIEVQFPNNQPSFQETPESLPESANGALPKESAEPKGINIEKAFETVLKLKEKVMTKTTFQNYRLRIKSFLNFLPDKTAPVNSITKKDVINFLNSKLENTTARTRNNYRSDLSSFFTELENNEYIQNNFILKINTLATKPERNKTFSDALFNDIFNHLEKTDTILLLFVQFIYYNLLRPVEVCRLKIKDIDLVERKIYFHAKNQPLKTKVIPKIVFKNLPNLTELDPENYLFSRYGYGTEWNASEKTRTDFFSKKFNTIVKKNFNLGPDYTLYSVRHTAITKLYRKLRETNSPQVAKSELMLISGHSSMDALNKYLRDIDAELPEDYSNLFD